MLTTVSRTKSDPVMIPRSRVQVTDGCVAVGARDEAAHEPGVELIRDGDVIRSIRVTCGCGKTMTLDCEYPSVVAT